MASILYDHVRARANAMLATASHHNRDTEGTHRYLHEYLRYQESLTSTKLDRMRVLYIATASKNPKAIRSIRDLMASHGISDSSVKHDIRVLRTMQEYMVGFRPDVIADVKKAIVQYIQDVYVERGDGKDDHIYCYDLNLVPGVKTFEERETAASAVERIVGLASITDYYRILGQAYNVGSEVGLWGAPLEGDGEAVLIHIHLDSVAAHYDEGARHYIKQQAELRRIGLQATENDLKKAPPPEAWAARKLVRTTDKSRGIVADDDEDEKKLRRRMQTLIETEHVEDVLSSMGLAPTILKRGTGWWIQSMKHDATMAPLCDVSEVKEHMLDLLYMMWALLIMGYVPHNMSCSDINIGDTQKYNVLHFRRLRGRIARVPKSCSKMEVLRAFMQALKHILQ